MTTPDRLIWGEALPLDLSATADGGSVAPDFATTAVTLAFDQVLPAGVAGIPLRREYRWRPGGASDAAFSFSAGVLRFDLTSVRVASELAPGNWKVYAAIGPPATTQDAVGPYLLFVEGPPAGALPTGGP